MIRSCCIFIKPAPLQDFLLTAATTFKAKLPGPDYCLCLEASGAEGNARSYHITKLKRCHFASHRHKKRCCNSLAVSLSVNRAMLGVSRRLLCAALPSVLRGIRFGASAALPRQCSNRQLMTASTSSRPRSTAGSADAAGWLESSRVPDTVSSQHAAA